MSSGLYNGVSGLSLGTGLYRNVSGLWGGASGLVNGFGFSPTILFAAGEAGGWYDPSDVSTMFQDDAGTVPVTAPGQTVGRILDKSGRGNHLTQATLSKRPLYQVDSGGYSYLQFDGSDDWFVSPTITPGVDEAQVFAGVYKASDVGTGNIAETSASVNVNNGAIRVFAPIAGSANAGMQTRGTATAASVSAASYPAPLKMVLAAIGDISADTAVFRVNGAQAASVTTDQGTGNYLAYPMYVGARAGTSNFFNGRIYSLIVRFGANLNAAAIGATEAWVNSQTGAY